MQFLENENIEYKKIKFRKNEKKLLKKIIEAIFEQEGE